MAIFNANELASIRGDLNALAQGTCNILSLSRTKTGTGGGSITWSTATAGATCDVWRMQTLPMERGASQGNDEVVARAEYTFALPHDTTITEANRIEYDGESFQVVRVDDALPSQLQLRVYVRRTETLS